VPSTLYGPDYPLDGRQMHFIFDLIRKILHGHLYGERVTLWGDGFQRREVVFIDDFIRIMLVLADSVDNDLINIGGGEDYSIREFAEMICEIIGFDFSKIEFDLTRYVGAKAKKLNTQKLRSMFPDLKMTPLRTGLEATIEWMRDAERGQMLLR